MSYPDGIKIRPRVALRVAPDEKGRYPLAIAMRLIKSGLADPVDGPPAPPVAETAVVPTGELETAVQGGAVTDTTTEPDSAVEPPQKPKRRARRSKK